LHLKASELFSLQTEAEFKVRMEEKIEIAKNLILKGLDDGLISESTDLSVEKIKALRKGLER
jgi:hypothetical protein